MYFVNKEDLYFYLLDEYKTNFEKIIIKTLLKHDGEIFSTFEELFITLNKKMVKNSKFVRNVFLNMNYLIANELFGKKTKKMLEEYIYTYVNKDYLILENECDILNLLHIILMLLIDNLTKLVNEVIDLDIIEKYYNEQLNLLKSAFYKGGKS